MNLWLFHLVITYIHSLKDFQIYNIKSDKIALLVKGNSWNNYLSLRAIQKIFEIIHIQTNFWKIVISLHKFVIGWKNARRYFMNTKSSLLLIWYKNDFQTGLFQKYFISTSSMIQFLMWNVILLLINCQCD